jgi:glycosyltransferase domain-containing protein
LDYYNQLQPDYNIIVSDSSAEDKKIINKEIVSSFPIKTLYINHKLDKKNNYFRQQAADVLAYVRTEYCLFCCDDDFITPNGIQQSIDFLENNHDFSISHGRFASFYIEKSRNGKKRFYLAPDNTNNTISFSEPELRLKDHFANLTVTLYSVYRSDFLKMIFNETLKFTDDERFAEILPSMLAIVYGKMKCLDLLYEVRERIPTSSGIVNTTMETFIKQGTFNEKYKKFRECLGMHLCKNSNLRHKEAELIIDEAMHDYLKKNYPNDFKAFVKIMFRNMFSSLNLSGEYAKIRTLYLKNKFRHFEPRNVFLSALEDPRSKYHADFINIKNCALSHSKL